MAEFKQQMIDHIPPLRRYARALVNRAESADDLVQDCLERAWAKQGQWDQARPLRPWLFSILHNVYANQARKYDRMPSLVSYSQDSISSSADDVDLTITDLQRGLDMLSSEHREILLLIGLEQMSYKDTAVVLNIPLGTVMSRLTRARKKLRELMTDPTIPTMPVIRRIK